MPRADRINRSRDDYFQLRILKEPYSLSHPVFLVSLSSHSVPVPSRYPPSAMAIVEGGHDDLMQLWAVITELGEQLNQNRSMSVSLYALAGKIKVICILERIIVYVDYFTSNKPSIRRQVSSFDGVSTI